MDMHFTYIVAVFSFFFIVHCNGMYTFESEEEDDDESIVSTYNNSELESCVRQILYNFRGNMKTGVPVLLIPKLDPLKVKDRKINSTLTDGKILTEFKGLLVRGLSNFYIQLMHVDTYNSEMEMSLGVKLLSVTGHYTMNGLVSVRNHGRFHVDATDAVILGRAKMAQDQNDHVIFTRIVLDVELPEIRVFFDSLLSGSETGKDLKDTLNTYGKLLFDMAKPALLQKLQAAFQRTINTQLGKMNTSSWMVKLKKIS